MLSYSTSASERRLLNLFRPLESLRGKGFGQFNMCNVHVKYVWRPRIRCVRSTCFRVRGPRRSMPNSQVQRWPPDSIRPLVIIQDDQ